MKYLIILIFPMIANAAIKRMAVIKNGVVVNIIALDDNEKKWKPEAGATLVDITNKRDIDIGSTCSECDGKDFQKPAPPQTKKDQTQMLDELDQRLKALETKSSQ